MADKDSNIIKTDQPAGFSNDQLLKMVVDGQKAQAESLRLLSDALIESRKPYVDPKIVAAKQAELEDMKRAVDLELRTRAIRKASCSHLREYDNRSNIKWMQHSNNIIKGVCGSCFSEFDTRNGADFNLLRGDQKGIANMGRAGVHAASHKIGQV
jgi:hypothetical protein